MHDAIIVVAPLLIGAVVLTLRFVGCSFHAPTTLSNYSEVVLNEQGLVSFWRLNEQSGTTATDSKDGNQGTYEGGVTLGGPSHVNTDTDNFAPTFDGTSGFVSVPFAANINPPQFTVEAIVDPSAVGPGDNTDFHAIVFNRSADVAGNAFGYILFLIGNEFRARVGTGTPTLANITVPAGVTPNGGPYYVVMTYDGTRLTLYVNAIDPVDPGNPGETLEQQASAAVAYAPNTTSDFLIGASNFPGPGERFFFPGVIQDVAVYDHALDFSSIQSHFFVIMAG